MRRTLLPVLLALAGCGDTSGVDTAGAVPGADSASPLSTGEALPSPPDDHAEVQRRLLLGPVEAIVATTDVAIAAAPPSARTPRAWRSARLAEIRARAFAPTRGLDVLRTWDHLAAAHVRLESRAALDTLLRRPDVRGVALNREHTPSLTQSLALVGQPAVIASGTTGAGVSVAVLDTGADYTVSDLGSCTAVGTPSTCRVAYAADFAPSDGTLDDGTHHGTNVASIVSRMAPDARILALDVFGSSGTASSADILSAINWVVANQATYNIVAMNLSLGGGASTAQCADVYYGGAFATARSAGVLPVVSSGNNAYTNALSIPACIADTLSVGAVYDSSFGTIGFSCGVEASAADRVTCFSNSASFLDLLAPGSLISAGGQTMSGTSQAAPHVAGAVALLASSEPSLGPDGWQERLVATGTSVYDSRNFMTFPRLDIGSAVAGCVASVTPTSLTIGAGGDAGTLDLTTGATCDWVASSDASWFGLTPTSGTGPATLSWSASANTGAARSANVAVAGHAVTASQERRAPPSGTMVIAGGASGARSTSVTLTLSSADAAEMCVSNTSSCASWEAYAASRAWILASGAGTKTVYVRFRDVYGNTSDPVTDTIALDATRPVDGSVTATQLDGALTLAFSGFSDAGAGVESYTVVRALTTAPTSCSVGTLVGSTTSTSFTDSGLVNGTTYAYRVCAVDGAGNVSTGATRTAIPAPETDPPTDAAVAINADAAYTNTTHVTLALSATDPSTVTRMCVSNSASCTTWETYATTKSWTLGGTGARTVYAWFRDAYGTTTASAATDSIVVDSTVPTNGTVAASASSRTVNLSWSGYADATSGVAAYKVVRAVTTAPSSCGAGTVITASTTSTSLTDTASLVDGTTYAYRVCAIDGAGNVSTGTTTTAIPRPETDAPVGTITLAGGADWTTSRSVVATLSATDASTVTAVCLSESTTCTSWVSYATSKSFSLSTTAGTHTVRAWFRDAYGNVSAATTDTIQLDTTAPNSGTLSASGSDGTVTLSWSGASDATSGVASYKLVGTSTSTPTNCTTGTTLTTGADTSYVHTGLTNGVTWNYRLCATDVAGNVSTGVGASTRPASEYDAPTGGSVAINGGDAWTGTTNVTLTLSATDASGVASVCVSNTTSCSAWSTYATTKSLTLGSRTGTKTVYVWFRDAQGNATAAAVTDSIGLDQTVPLNGTGVVSASGGGSVTLTWSGFSDAQSGLDSYRVAASVVSSPTNCKTASSLVYSGTDTTTTLTGLATGTRVYYRICAVDAVGNFSSGVALSAVP